MQARCVLFKKNNLSILNVSYQIKKRLIHRVKQGGEKLAQLQLAAQRVEMNIMFIY